MTTPLAPVIGITNNGVVGQNSNGDDMNEFVITYRSGIVSETNYNAATAIQPNLLAYTDCSNYATFTIGFSTQQSVVGSQHNTQPCLRVDRITWNPKNGSSPPNLAAKWASTASCFPSGYIFPHRQEVQFLNGSGFWKPFYLHINGLGNPGVETSLLTIIDIWYIDVNLSMSQNGLVPGFIKVRYRNNHMGSSTNGGPCVTQPDNTWVTETWFVN